MIALCESFGPHGMYGEQLPEQPMAEDLPQRFDAAFNYIKSGGLSGEKVDLASLASRTNYFRETYAYGDDIRLPGIEPFLHSERFIDAAKSLYGRPIVEPAIVFANLMVPGQELAIHSDVPEFRGANRKIAPEWLLAAMHHSGLFEAWRMPIATAVSWFHVSGGGGFAFYPNGPEGPAEVYPASFNTALLIDTDSVFHGVARVDDSETPLPVLSPGMRLVPLGDGRWVVLEGDREVIHYQWSQLRFSVSWKAYCFDDEAERKAWREHTDDLSLASVLETLKADLRRRGRLSSNVENDYELAGLMTDEYIRFPRPPNA